MAYTSKAQIITRWGTTEVVLSADRDPQDGVSDDAAIAAVCDDASSFIDSFLVSKYKVPIDPVPAVLVEIASDIAIYKLSQGQGPLTVEKRKRYDDALAWLMRAAKGEDVGLPGAPDDQKVAHKARANGFPLAYQATNLRGGGLL